MFGSISLFRNPICILLVYIVTTTSQNKTLSLFFDCETCIKVTSAQNRNLNRCIPNNMRTHSLTICLYFQYFDFCLEKKIIIIYNLTLRRQKGVDIYYTDKVGDLLTMFWDQ